MKRKGNFLSNALFGVWNSTELKCWSTRVKFWYIVMIAFCHLNRGNTRANWQQGDLQPFMIVFIYQIRYKKVLTMVERRGRTWKSWAIKTWHKMRSHWCKSSSSQNLKPFLFRVSVTAHVYVCTFHLYTDDTLPFTHIRFRISVTFRSHKASKP